MRTLPSSVVCLQWFRDEVSRAYVLHKAAMVHETLATQRGPSPFTPPAYLTQRVQDKLALPEVELTSLGPEEEGTGKRAANGKRRRKAGEAEVDEEERVATVAFVVQELNRQLYVELLMGLQLRGPTLIEEEEEDPDTEDEEENAEKGTEEEQGGLSSSDEGSSESDTEEEAYSVCSSSSDEGQNGESSDEEEE